LIGSGGSDYGDANVEVLIAGKVPWADVNVADDITLTNLTQITTRSYADLQNLPHIPTDATIDSNVYADISNSVMDANIYSRITPALLDANIFSRLSAAIWDSNVYSRMTNAKMDANVYSRITPNLIDANVNRLLANRTYGDANITDMNYSKLSGQPSCPAGQAVQNLADTIVCVAVGSITDTNCAVAGSCANVIYGNYANTLDINTSANMKAANFKLPAGGKIYHNDTAVLAFSNDGNVGIGANAATPITPLDIRGATGQSNLLRVSNPGGTANLLFTNAPTARGARLADDYWNLAFGIDVRPSGTSIDNNWTRALTIDDITAKVSIPVGISGNLTMGSSSAQLNLSNNGDLNGNNISYVSGVLKDASNYWLGLATNWGGYWNTTTNQIQFHNAGVQKWLVDLDTGDVNQAGDLQISGNDILSSTGSTAITLSNEDIIVAGNLETNAIGVNNSSNASYGVITSASIAGVYGWTTGYTNWGFLGYDDSTYQYGVYGLQGSGDYAGYFNGNFYISNSGIGTLDGTNPTTITLADAMPDTTYAVFLTLYNCNLASSVQYGLSIVATNRTTTTFDVNAFEADYSNSKDIASNSTCQFSWMATDA
jgi:hypothetical protein